MILERFEEQQKNAVSEASTVSGNPVTDGEKAELAHVNAMLHQRLREPRGMQRAFPEPLESLYRSNHLALTLSQQRAFWPWVVVTVGIFCVFGAIMAQNQQAVIYPLNAVIALAVLAPVLVIKVKALSRFVLFVNGLAASVTLLAFQVASVVLPDAARQKSVSEYAIIFITIAAFTIARLPLRQAVIWVTLSLVLSRLIGLVLGVDLELDRLLYYGGGSLTFGYLLGFIQYARERTVFAQEYLLEEEKRQLKQLSSELAQLSRSDQLTGLNSGAARGPTTLPVCPTAATSMKCWTCSGKKPCAKVPT